MELAEWAGTNRLSTWVHNATDNLLDAVCDFADDDPRWLGPYLPTVNPPIWEIAHVAWFAEWFVLRQLHGHEPLMEGVDRRYDSAKIEHTIRWDLSYPSPAETKDYVRRVADALVGVLEDDRGVDSTAHFVAYAITHFDAHCEALTYTRQTLEWGPNPAHNTTESMGTVPGLSPLKSSCAGEGDGDASVTGGRLLLGASRDQPLVMDNEKWAHPVEVADFAMARAAVTVADFAQFVDAGGYDNDLLWSTGGRKWRTEVRPQQPVYWRRTDDGWELRQFDRWLPVEACADQPMVHVSWWEAEAFCNWAQRRLPTEAEWEYAATTDASGERQPWFPWGNRDPLPAEANLDGRIGTVAPVGAFEPGDGPWGHRQLIGNVWEWTSTTFEPYPHFEPDAYRDNSEPWFGTRNVLRGGSFATQNRYVRSTFRNFFTPDRRDVFAGFRTCAR